MKEIKKHLILWGLLIHNSLMSQLEYRANFFTGIAMELGYFLAKIVYMIVIYKTGVPINGLTPDEVLVFFGTYMIATGPYAGLYMMNLFDVGRQVQTGDLDLLLVKPVSLQFMLTLKRSDLSIFTVDVLLGIAAVTVGLVRMAVPVGLLDMLGYLGFLLSGSLIAYSMFLLPQVLAFRLVKTNSLAGLVDSSWDFNNLPMGIYSRLVQQIGVFVLPIFVITNFPALFLLHKMEPLYAVWGIAGPFVWFLLTSFLFRLGLKHYQSASS
ncbi:MAG: ABC-2 family transporter protein [Eubacteriales bacterium]|nr:ABC-2 family transporter protein [Eubacteriales bacterium]